MLELNLLSTELLGDGLHLCLVSHRKGVYTYLCKNCNRSHSGSIWCEFCLSSELYTRRKSLEFTRLDLTIQAAVCLLANTSRGGAERQAGENLSSTRPSFGHTLQDFQDSRGEF